MSVKDELITEIENMTEKEKRDFFDLVRFGFDRLKAGEKAEDIYQDWESQRKAVAV